MSKSFWENLKEKTVEGFMPAAARADKNIERNRKETGNQLQADLQESPEERARKIRQGFMKRVMHDE